MATGQSQADSGSGVQNENRRWPIAAAVTAFYGLTYFFWYYAVTTEQYTSAVAWTLAVVLLAFRWERERRDGYLLALAFLMGVALAHMVTLLFIAPPLLWFVLRTDPKLVRRPRLMAGVIALALLPLLSYIYVYVRGAQHPEWRGAGQWASTGQWFLSFLSTRQGRDELTWSLKPFLTSEFPGLIWRELTWPGLIAGILGIAAIGRRRAIMLYATLAIYLVFCWIDRLGNWYQVIMPAYALVVVGLGAGAGWLWQRMGERFGAKRGVADEKRRRRAWAARAALILGLAALVIYRGAASFPRADSSHRAEDTGLQPGWAILADDPPAGTAVLGTLGETLALNYLTEIWGERPDVRSVTSEQAQKLLAGGAAAGGHRSGASTGPRRGESRGALQRLGAHVGWLERHRPRGIWPSRARRRWVSFARGYMTSAASCSSRRDGSASTAPRARPLCCWSGRRRPRPRKIGRFRCG